MIVTIRNVNFDGLNLTEPVFWHGQIRFVNCTFRGAYIGSSSRVLNSVKIDLSKVFFKNCDFKHCNFKGAKKLNLRSFHNPKNIATTRWLPRRILKHFENTPCSYDDSLKDLYRRAGVMNKKITGVSSRRITDYFGLGG